MDSDIKNAKILIVDDQPSNVELLLQVLKLDGYKNLRSTTDSREVLSTCEEFDPDLLLLDLQMPSMSGLQVMEQLKARENKRYFPVLVITSQSDPDIRDRVLSNGARGFMGKPVNLLEVLNQVRSLLEEELSQAGHES